MPKASVAVLEARTVGVVHREDGACCAGYTLLSAGTSTFLLDLDGRVAHEWHSLRTVFAAHLLDGGDLLRDGSDCDVAPMFQAGGAAGYVERVTWAGQLVWSWAAEPRFRYLSHHDLEPMPNGHVLVLVWERISGADAIARGRHPELLPDGEMWDNLVVELAPPAARGGRAAEVWRFSQLDHVVQDHDAAKPNFVSDVAAHPNKLDINYCPPGGKAKCRGGGAKRHPSGLAVFDGAPGATGEKDWLHANAISYDAERGLVLLSYNVLSEVVIIDHSKPGGGILFRFGNAAVSRRGSRLDQELFVQHSAQFVPTNGGDRSKVALLLFNNGRAPDRMWSTVDEYEFDVATGAARLVWRFGPSVGRAGSFYATHSSGVNRCANGNTLVTLGPQGIVFEVTRGSAAAPAREVWRYVSPAEGRGERQPAAFVAQGQQRQAGRFDLFNTRRYALDHPAFHSRVLTPGRHLEGEPAA